MDAIGTYNCDGTDIGSITDIFNSAEAMRVGLGPGVLMSYILQGLVHPARKVREVSQAKTVRTSQY